MIGGTTILKKFSISVINSFAFSDTSTVEKGQKIGIKFSSNHKTAKIINPTPNTYDNTIAIQVA